ncbi:hypothetical protein GCM10009037_15760 [Halarchaeum grantii]|uniref:Uncharacterized protein n=1 Tax=Halarchaeum grantii TaxID=1193105 RepID=A0A830F2I3_9EURY|nr:hypothetical protein [Halarchaeum grantii]GGL32940.1 hypothetical protein GCM10009037_15760 [Halarchaeum grantii]
MTGRAQANLLALCVALLLVSGALGVALAFAGGAFGSVDRSADDARLADSLAASAVAADGPLAMRANVLDRDALDDLDAASVGASFPAARGHAVRLTLDDAVLVDTGDASGGARVDRLVLVAERQTRSYAPAFDADTVLSLPRRTDRLTVAVTPPQGVVVEAVAVDGRVVLREPATAGGNATTGLPMGGLGGTYDVSVSRYRDATVTVAASAPLPAGSVVVTSYPVVTHKATLGVRVDA